MASLSYLISRQSSSSSSSSAVAVAPKEQEVAATTRTTIPSSSDDDANNDVHNLYTLHRTQAVESSATAAFGSSRPSLERTLSVGSVIPPSLPSRDHVSMQQMLQETGFLEPPPLPEPQNNNLHMSIILEEEETSEELRQQKSPNPQEWSVDFSNNSTTTLPLVAQEHAPEDCITSNGHSPDRRILPAEGPESLFLLHEEETQHVRNNSTNGTPQRKESKSKQHLLERNPSIQSTLDQTIADILALDEPEQPNAMSKSASVQKEYHFQPQETDNVDDEDERDVDISSMGSPLPKHSQSQSPSIDSSMHSTSWASSPSKTAAARSASHIVSPPIGRPPLTAATATDSESETATTTTNTPRRQGQRPPIPQDWLLNRQASHLSEVTLPWEMMTMRNALQHPPIVKNDDQLEQEYQNYVGSSDEEQSTDVVSISTKDSATASLPPLARFSRTPSVTSLEDRWLTASSRKARSVSPPPPAEEQPSITSPGSVSFSLSPTRTLSLPPSFVSSPKADSNPLLYPQGLLKANPLPSPSFSSESSTTILRAISNKSSLTASLPPPLQDHDNDNNDNESLSFTEGEEYDDEALLELRMVAHLEKEPSLTVPTRLASPPRSKTTTATSPTSTRTGPPRTQPSVPSRQHGGGSPSPSPPRPSTLDKARRLPSLPFSVESASSVSLQGDGRTLPSPPKAQQHSHLEITPRLSNRKEASIVTTASTSRPLAVPPRPTPSQSSSKTNSSATLTISPLSSSTYSSLDNASTTVVIPSQQQKKEIAVSSPTSSTQAVYLQHYQGKKASIAGRPPRPPSSSSSSSSTYNILESPTPPPLLESSSLRRVGSVRVRHYPMQITYRLNDQDNTTAAGWYSGPLNDQGEMHGNGAFWFTSGSLYLGQFAHNCLHGIGALSIQMEGKRTKRKVVKGYFDQNEYTGDGAPPPEWFWRTESLASQSTASIKSSEEEI